MKYPLASLNKLMEVFGKNILYGYDIKCALEKILLRSSLANRIKELNLQGVVPAFHGHAHNRLCQVQHHSKYKLGAGKEDFETCERVFQSLMLWHLKLGTLPSFIAIKLSMNTFASLTWTSMLIYVRPKFN